MASARAAVKHIDWSKLTVSLPKETAASLQAFRKRNDEARRVLNELKQQRTDVDFDHYRKTLKNQSIVDDAQKALTGFKAATYSVDAQLQAIDQFEAKAVSNVLSTLVQWNPTTLHELSHDTLMRAYSCYRKCILLNAVQMLGANACISRLALPAIQSWESPNLEMLNLH